MRGMIQMFGGFELTMPVFWTILAIAFVIIEAATMGLATIWFSIGALLALLCAALNLPIWVQIVVFVVSSVVLLVYTRPLAKKVLKIGNVKTNAESLVGKNGIVTKEITTYETGLVKVNGQVWTAKGENDTVIEKDKIVEVVSIEGVKLIVKAVG